MSTKNSSQPAVIRVLVADRAALVNESLTLLLSEIEGLSVFGCSQEASKVLALVERLRPDVVILDLQVPGPDGFALLKHLLQIRPVPKLMVLSHYTFPPFREKCLRGGADFFFDKSTELPRVTEALKAMIALRNAVF